MNKTKQVFLFFVAMCVHFKDAQSQGFLKTDGKRIVNDKGENVLLRGVGLGGWMLQEGYMLNLDKDGQQYRIRQKIEMLIGEDKTTSFYNTWLSNHTTRSDIDSLHAWGFNSVRLPMHYNLFTLPAELEPMAGQNTWLLTGFILTDSLIAWCKANQMYVILDLHAAPGGQGNDENISDRDPTKPSLWQSRDNQQKTIALWKKLAERYAYEPTVAGYDLLNEPNWGFTDTAGDRNGLQEQKNIPLRQLLMEITESIRTVDKNHIIIIEGNGWGNNYNGMMGPWDSNMVLSFHKYWNQNDQQSIQYIINYRDKYHMPVWLGETGENSNVWFTEAIRLFETNNIGWSWWPLKKMGNNNPLQIRSNKEYDSLASYWNRKTTSPPSESNVYIALMELASNTKNERNLIHRDVIDAMIRQPFSNKVIPFKPNKILPGTLLQAVDYDLGRNGYSYFDHDTANYRISTGKEGIGNRGRAYRNDGVDIYEDFGKGGIFYVGDIESGEWLQYTIDMVQAGKYQLILDISAPDGDGMISLTNGTDALSGNIYIPSRKGKSNREKIILKNIYLAKGIHHLRLYAQQGGFNFYSITFKK